MADSITYRELIDGSLSNFGISPAAFWSNPVNYLPAEHGLCDEDEVYIFHLKGLLTVDPSPFPEPEMAVTRPRRLIREYADSLGLGDDLTAMAAHVMEDVVKATVAGETVDQLAQAAQLEQSKSDAARKWIRAGALAICAGDAAGAAAYLQSAHDLIQSLGHDYRHWSEYVKGMTEHVADLLAPVNEFAQSATRNRVEALQKVLSGMTDLA